jgi:excisionase family DNA binding protein
METEPTEDIEMNALLDRPDTVVPSEEDKKLATESSRILSRQRPEGELRVRLDNDEVLTLPKAATRLLAHLLTEMSHGNAVTLIPVHAELTTQEAADYLNVSRPFLIGLLEAKTIPHRRVGTHRRIKFLDLQNYKKQLDQERDAALAELAEQAQKLKMGY